MKALEITQLRVRVGARKARERRPDPLTAVLKVKGTELLQATTELAMDVGGPLSMPDWAEELAALTNEPEVGPGWATQATGSYLFLRAASIYGGTNEIQKNILQGGAGALASSSSSFPRKREPRAGPNGLPALDCLLSRG